jgi:hypothetical protein
MVIEPRNGPLGTEHVHQRERRHHHRHLGCAGRLELGDPEIDSQRVGGRLVCQFEIAAELLFECGLGVQAMRLASSVVTLVVCSSPMMRTTTGAT